MKILVAVKRVIDYNVQVRVKEDRTGVVTYNLKMSTNPPDDNAIEQAVKIKESGKAKEIVAITIGEEEAQETVELRSKEQNEPCHYEKVGKYYIVYRTRDRKVMKNINYYRPNLKQFFTEKEINNI